MKTHYHLLLALLAANTACTRACAVLFLIDEVPVEAAMLAYTISTQDNCGQQRDLHETKCKQHCLNGLPARRLWQLPKPKPCLGGELLLQVVYPRPVQVLPTSFYWETLASLGQYTNPIGLV